MKRETRILLAVTMALALGACGKPLAPIQDGKTFTTGQLGSIVLSVPDLPEGLQLVPRAHGSQPIDQIVGSPEEKAKLVGYGFVGAEETTFVNADALAILSGRGPGGSDAEIVASTAIVFKTAAGAHQALEYEHHLDLSRGTNVTTISIQNLGDETFAVKGTQPNVPFPRYLISWRVGTGVFAVILAGGSASDASMDRALQLAKIMSDRASRIAT